MLDNEAVSALRDVGHRRHRAALAHMEAAAGRRRRGAVTRVLVPAAVRVEAGWDRRRPESAAINSLPVADAPLDRPTADAAADIVARTAVSVADAHVGAVVLAIDGDDVVVLTSDPDDMRRAAAPARITAVRL